jgi:uncharacterized LabA/DUF88 family protein
MTAREKNNYAFVDSQNLNLSIRQLGWKLDFARFKTYLTEKYKVKKAFLFIGYIPGNESLYQSLQEAGFVCVFKPALTYKDGKTKGNCDAELVLWTMIEYAHFDKAIIVSGDGDFHCLAEHLLKNDKLECLLIPDKKKFSALLRLRAFRPYLRFMNDLQSKLEYKKKRPHKDETLQGTSSVGDVNMIQGADDKSSHTS